MFAAVNGKYSAGMSFEEQQQYKKQQYAQQQQQRYQQQQQQNRVNPNQPANPNGPVPTGFVGRTFTSDANGNVRMNPGIPVYSNDNSPNLSSHSSPATNPNVYANQDKHRKGSVHSEDGSYSARSGYSYNSNNSNNSNGTNDSKVPRSGYASAKHPNNPSNGTASASTESASGSAKRIVPRPCGLFANPIENTIVELTWRLAKPAGSQGVPVDVSSYSIELTWRENSMGSSWQSAKKLICGNVCRKKNLIPGVSYEFRLRAVEELKGGMLGK